ncbi:MAG: FtsQ-type POTRA domain-containing protein [Clostridia bacterium]|nr:FtsQ-type POTRA domain-containing protein [Clostridia bacterium]
MLKSKKKLIIILSIVLVIVAIIIISSALFSLKSVSIEYASLLKNDSVMSTYDKEEIVKVGNFAYNKNILFISYDGAKERIEKAFPYVKVEKFVRNFPNGVVVYLTERQPVFAKVRSDGRYVVFDGELKVLEVAVSLSGAATGIPVLSAPDISVDTLKAGETYSNNALQTIAFNLKRGIFDNDVDLPISIMSSLSFTEGNTNEEYVVNITLNDGAKIEIKGINNFAEKVLGAFYTYKTKVKDDDTQYPYKNKVTVKVEEDFTLAERGKVVPVEVDE